MKICDREIKIQGSFIRIARPIGEKYKFLEQPEPIIQGLRTSGARVDLFTFLQSLPETSPKFTYPWEYDNLAVLPISTFEHWLNSQIRFAPRGRLRQAEKKGVTAREVSFDDALVRGIWEIYNETPLRQGRRFPHFGEDLETVRKAEATFPESSIFIGAFLGQELIGFAKLVHDDTMTQANLMNILSLLKYRDKCPTNVLIAQAVRSCAERGIKYLVYQNFSYRNKQADGLSRFKEVNGFQRVELPRYYVPLTRLGEIAFRLGLHHRLLDRLPQPIATKARELRTAWYQRTLDATTEAS